MEETAVEEHDRIHQEYKDVFLHRYKDMRTPYLKTMWDEAREQNRLAGSTHQTIARCEAIYEILKERGEV